MNGFQFCEESSGFNWSLLDIPYIEGLGYRKGRREEDGEIHTQTEK